MASRAVYDQDERVALGEMGRLSLILQTLTRHT